MPLFGDPIKEGLDRCKEYETVQERIAYFVGYLLTWTILRPLPVAAIILWVWWFLGS